MGNSLICPKCGREYTESAQAVSRESNEAICSSCAMKEAMSNAVFCTVDDRGLPQFCYALIPGENAIGKICRDEQGYWPVRFRDNRKRNRSELIKAADLLNEKIHVAPDQREAMLCGSMFGWNCPAAIPENHKKAGA